MNPHLELCEAVKHLKRSQELGKELRDIQVDGCGWVNGSMSSCISCWEAVQKLKGYSLDSRPVLKVLFIKSSRSGTMLIIDFQCPFPSTFTTEFTWLYPIYVGQTV